MCQTAYHAWILWNDWILDSLCTNSIYVRGLEMGRNSFRPIWWKLNGSFAHLRSTKSIYLFTSLLWELCMIATLNLFSWSYGLFHDFTLFFVFLSILNLAYHLLIEALNPGQQANTVWSLANQKTYDLDRVLLVWLYDHLLNLGRCQCTDYFISQGA